jgi:CDGSH-type Zn-finger protein/uncharacterized Fe-S cluster protein YjdI
MTIETAEGRKVTLTFDGSRCIHARRCVMGQPSAFVANAKGEWLHPDAVSPEELMRVALNCPSGAIQVKRKDGGEEEGPPRANIIMVRENGPLAVHADLTIRGERHGYRATLCRCGASKNKPFCDGSHTAAGFRATGEPDARESTLSITDLVGPVEITPTPDGPYRLKGAVEIESGTGRNVNRLTKAFLCRCGHSNDKPYCDGSHSRVGFKSG